MRIFDRLLRQFRCLLLLLLMFVGVCSSSSIPFRLNPSCTMRECQEPGNAAIFYAKHDVDNDTIHVLFSSFDQLTISVLQTKKGFEANFDYSALFTKNYSNAVTFKRTEPMNSFSLVLRRLMLFNDQNDTATIDANDTTIQSFWFDRCQTNLTGQMTDFTEPIFYLPLEDIHGQLEIHLIYPGQSSRDTQFPKLTSIPQSYFLNLVLQADNYTLAKTRFALEFVLMQKGLDAAQMSSSKSIDDQYTPGIFTTWYIESNSPLFSSSMLWKPVVYQSSDRSIEHTTLMKIYPLQNNVVLDPSIDQGIFRDRIFLPSSISAFNISLGRAKDGFFRKSNYSFLQLTAGLDYLELDSTRKPVILALIFTLTLPSLVIIVALIFIIKRRCTVVIVSGYEPMVD